jgi:hypothetical protein
VICNAVHDSCVFQVPQGPDDEIDRALEAAEYWFTTGVIDYMRNAFGINFNLPLEVDFEIGAAGWGDLTKWNFSKQELMDIKQKLKAS